MNIFSMCLFFFAHFNHSQNEIINSCCQPWSHIFIGLMSFFSQLKFCGYRFAIFVMGKRAGIKSNGKTCFQCARCFFSFSLPLSSRWTKSIDSIFRLSAFFLIYIFFIHFVNAPTLRIWNVNFQFNIVRSVLVYTVFYVIFPSFFTSKSKPCGSPVKI